MKHINTTLDYYLVPFARREGFTIQQFSDTVFLLHHQKGGTMLAVINRYLSRRDYRSLIALKNKGYQLIYFMDDDLFDKTAMSSLLPDYAKRLQKKATKHQKFLRTHIDELWVSTDYLANKYADWQVRIIKPMTTSALQNQKQPVWICYHGTASHQLELTWLSDMVMVLQQRSHQTRFEVFGDHAVLKQFRHIERVHVLHPMGWDNYVDYTQSICRDIALVPLLPDPFNQARSVTKFFDNTRMGAVGVYTNVTPYANFIIDGVNGFLLDNEPSLWIEKIEYLIRHPEIRQQVIENAKKQCEAGLPAAS